MKNLTIASARAKLRQKEFKAVELVEYYLKRIEDNKDLNAFITVTGEQAIAAARVADKRMANGEDLPLLGVPLGIKDLFCTKGTRTTAASKILSEFVPAYESTVTQNLLDSGAIFLGKTNMDEFAMGSSNTTSYFGPCFLPYRKKTDQDTQLVPGGSSGGSAAAVAADMCIAATASDTGGSIRQPASFAGLVGIKPTYGLCSRYGMVAFASSLDQAGPLTKTVEDAAIMLNHMASYDEKDSTSEDVVRPDYVAYLHQSIKGMKIGLPKEYLENLNDDCAKMIEKAVDILKSEECEIIDVSLPTTSYALPAYYIIAPAEASSNLARYDGVRYTTRADHQNLEELYVNSRSEGFGDEVKRRILIGTYVLSAGFFDAYYLKALKIQRLIQNDFKDNAFQKVDLLITPTTPSTAFGMSEADKMSPVEMYQNDIFTVNANIAGLPAMSIPGGLSSKDCLPLGLQLIADKFQEGNIFKVASLLERSLGFEAMRSDIVWRKL